jgi:hypothetical protein
MLRNSLLTMALTSDARICGIGSFPSCLVTKQVISFLAGTSTQECAETLAQPKKAGAQLAAIQGYLCHQEEGVRWPKWRGMA